MMKLIGKKLVLEATEQVTTRVVASGMDKMKEQLVQQAKSLISTKIQ